jgi:hypothetical protein
MIYFLQDLWAAHRRERSAGIPYQFGLVIFRPALNQHGADGFHASERPLCKRTALISLNPLAVLHSSLRTDKQTILGKIRRAE